MDECKPLVAGSAAHTLQPSRGHTDQGVRGVRRPGGAWYMSPATSSTRVAPYLGDALLQSATCRWMYYNAKTLEMSVLEHAQRCKSREELSLVVANEEQTGA